MAHQEAAEKDRFVKRIAQSEARTERAEMDRLTVIRQKSVELATRKRVQAEVRLQALAPEKDRETERQRETERDRERLVAAAIFFYFHSFHRALSPCVTPVGAALRCVSVLLLRTPVGWRHSLFQSRSRSGQQRIGRCFWRTNALRSSKYTGRLKRSSRWRFLLVLHQKSSGFVLKMMKLTGVCGGVQVGDR